MPVGCDENSDPLMTKEQYLTWFDEVLQPTEPTFLRVPPEKLDFKLTERSFSIGQLVSHIPASLSFMAKVIRREELPQKSLRGILLSNRHQSSASVEEGVKRLKAATSEFKDAVGALTEDRFQYELLDTPQRGRVHYWRYCAFVLEHHIHHLMELHLCLKVLGVRVNTITLYAGG